MISQHWSAYLTMRSTPTNTCFVLRAIRRTDDPSLLATLNNSFVARLPGVMDQSQHTGADARGEGAAYEFGQQLDAWEKEREWQILGL